MWNKAKAWSPIARGIKRKETGKSKAAVRGTEKRCWGELSPLSGGKWSWKWPGTRPILWQNWAAPEKKKSSGYPVLESNWDIMLNSRHSKEAHETSCCGFAAAGRKIKLRNLDIEITIAMPLLLLAFLSHPGFVFIL